MENRSAQKFTTASQVLMQAWSCLLPNQTSALRNSEIQLITRWIEQGAAYEPHWAFTRVEKPKVPASTMGK